MKKLMIFAISAAALGVMSCQKSEIYRPEEIPGKPNETSVQVSLATESLQAPVVSRTETKAAASGEEAISVIFGGEEVDTKVSDNLSKAQDSKITDIWAVQYDKDGNLVGTPYYTEVTDAGSEQTTGGLDWKYNLSVNLTTMTDAGTVYFVANTHSPSTFTTVNVPTEAQFKALTKHVGGASNEWKFTENSTIPMIGYYKGTVNASTKIENVKLTRLFAKIVLKYKSASTIEITGITLKNVPTTYAFDTTVKRTATTIFPAKNTTSGSESHMNTPAVGKAALEALTVDGGYKTLVWYMPENYRGVNSAVDDPADRILTATDGMGTYIEFKGQSTSFAACSLLTYTVMLGNPETSKGGATGNFNVERNSVYNVTVDIVGMNTSDNRVETETFDMSNCAIVTPNSGESGQHIFDIRKMYEGWQTTALTSFNNLRAEVLWQDRTNVLSASDVSLDKTTGLLTVKSTHNVSGNAVVALYNATSGGQILWSWHIWVTSYNPDPKNGTDGHPYPAGMNVAYNTTGGKVHRYGVKFQQTNSNKVIMDRNLGAVNTYYTAPAASASKTDLQNTFGMFYQWGRKDPLPYVDASTINATNATGTTIAIYNAANTALAEATAVNTAAAGYKRYSIDNVTRETDKYGKSSTLKYSVQNPLTFIYNAGTPYDWYAKDADNQNNALWGDGANKSPYDPCPKGWRVAPNGTWSDFTRTTDVEQPLLGNFPYYSDGVAGEKYGTGNYKATNGRLYKVTASGTGTPLAWYPAPGFRDAGNSGRLGALANVGSSGYSWSSAVSSTGGVFLHFNAQSLNPSYVGGRGHGLQLRCLSE